MTRTIRRVSTFDTNANALRLMSTRRCMMQGLPQSAVPISQHPRLRDAVHLNQMFSPSSEPGQSGWHILDPDGKRVMDPKKLMDKKEEDDDKGPFTYAVRNKAENLSHSSHIF